MPGLSVNARHETSITSVTVCITPPQLIMPLVLHLLDTRFDGSFELNVIDLFSSFRFLKNAVARHAVSVFGTSHGVEHANLIKHKCTDVRAVQHGATIKSPFFVFFYNS